MGIDRLVVRRLFDSDIGVSVSGLISLMDVRRILVEKLGALTIAQCDARVNIGARSLGKTLAVVIDGPAVKTAGRKPP